MALIDFAQRMREIEEATARTEDAVNKLKNTIEGVKAPFDDLIETAERTGSACANVGGAIVEVVRLSGTVTPALEGVMWEMYQMTEKLEDVKTVSRDVLDQVAQRMNTFVPQYELWTKHWLALAEQGKMSLEELEKQIEDWFNSPGIIQMNTTLGGDIPNFLLEMRRLMKELKEAENPVDRFGRALDKLTDQAEDATKAVEEVKKTTAGMTGVGGKKGSTPGSMGSSNNRDEEDGDANSVAKSAGGMLMGASKR